MGSVTNDYRLVPKSYNTNIQKVIRLSREMMVLADNGDRVRQDKSCGVIFGILRDTAYRLRELAEKERDMHREEGLWDVDDERA